MDLEARRHEKRSDSDRPYLGLLVTRLPTYDSTFGLDVLVRRGVPDERPPFEVEDETHLLAIEQAEGITQQRYQKIVSVALHGHR